MQLFPSPKASNKDALIGTVGAALAMAVTWLVCEALLDNVAPILDGMVCRLTDPHTLEVDVAKEHNLNDVFTQLTAANVEVLSMRNKSNRLEELFVELVKKTQGAKA